MTDYFTLLEEPRLPWLDPDQLKAKFLALSAQTHPDRLHGAPEAERAAAEKKFSELNTAYNCLRDAKERLRHLIELETGARPKDIERVPSDLLEYFAEVGGLCRSVDTFLAEKSAATSPILRAQMFARGLECTDKITTLLKRLQDRRAALEEELKTLPPPAALPNQKTMLPLERLEAIYRLLGYFGRWITQLQERNVQLAV